MKKGFTLIELIVTMVILGIVAYIASGLIAKTYISYNQTNTINRANQKLENALTLIANRLNYAINNTIIKRKSESDTTLFPISSAPNDYEVLEWIGYDMDGFIAYSNGSKAPGWSGFCDIKRSSKTTIVTPASNLNLENKIIRTLSDNQAGLDIPNSVAIFFPENYNYKNVGFMGLNLPFNSNGVTTVLDLFSSSGPEYKDASLTITSTDRIVEKYKLSWSAYAVVPTGCKTEDGIRTCDLELKYNYRPWQNETLRGSSSSLITTNVTVFKTYATENRIHIKLCIKDKYLADKPMSICKEKVVYK